MRLKLCWKPCAGNPVRREFISPFCTAADKGITGTSIKKRDDFNKLMRHCKQGKIDMIITKSVARFARNTLDCLKHTRMLKEYNVDVYFEEQGIHSIQPGSEFYITIYGSLPKANPKTSAPTSAGAKHRARKKETYSSTSDSLGITEDRTESRRLIPNRQLRSRGSMKDSSQATASPR